MIKNIKNYLKKKESNQNHKILLVVLSNNKLYAFLTCLIVYSLSHKEHNATFAAFNLSLFDI